MKAKGTMRKRTGRTARGRYEQMTAAELARATAEFDREFVADSFAAASPGERRWFERARRKPGRPREGRGARVISVSVEGELLERADALARDLGVTRARLIARGLKAVLEGRG